MSDRELRQVLGEGSLLDPTRCAYRDASGALRCKRKREDGGPLCFFHDLRNSEEPTPREFKTRLLELAEAGDGRWQGFVFPSFLEFNELAIKCAVDCSHARIGNLRLTACKFAEDVSFNESTFSGAVTIGHCQFAKKFNCWNADFASAVMWSSQAAERANFGESRFRQPVQVYGQLNGGSVWNGATFFDAVDFHGGWFAFMSTGGKRPDASFESHGLFGGETHMQSIDFRRPERVRFLKVDLSRVRVGNTDFRGVGFHDVTWAMIGSRRAIYDEVWDLETKDAHAPMLSEIESSYRSIRVSIEDGKDFSTASDFYYGEMDARRRQLPRYRRYLFSIEALYFALSGYGCSSLRALGWLLAVIGLHALVTGSLLYGVGLHLPDSIQSLLTMKRTLTLLAPLSTAESGHAPLPSWWFLADVLFGVWAVVQTALFVLALRGRIKRG